MSARLLAYALLGSALCAPFAASAQAPVDIHFDTVIKEPAATGLRVYRFAALSGTMIRAQIETSDLFNITLHTHDGEEMLSIDGRDNGTLEAMVSKDDAYLLSVTRSDLSKPYTLRFTGVEPDLHLAHFAHNVGYVYRDAKTGERQWEKCWVVPGEVRRDVFPSYHHDVTIGRNGRETSMMTGGWGDGRPEPGYTVTVRFEGEEMVRTQIVNGKPRVHRSPIVSNGPDNWIFNRYLCDPDFVGPGFKP